MFTGITTDFGEVVGVSAGEGNTRLEIRTNYDTSSILIGGSIACNGCCLTVVGTKPGRFTVDVSAETLGRTTLGDWRKGARINLERSLNVGDELGGHLVSGHVDCVGTVVEAHLDGGSIRYIFQIPADITRFIAEKGSLAVDGVSLTANAVSDDTFEVNVIPHTCSVTGLGSLKTGQMVNIEIDMLARYVARLLNKT